MPKKSIVIVTTTRAEYGLLSPIIHKLMEDERLDVRVAVTGTHLSAEHGNTVDEILADGVKPDVCIPILDTPDSGDAECTEQSRIQSRTLVGFGEYFGSRHTDAVLVLGDRFETLAVCMAALDYRIPVIHMHGGETTEGAMDEMIRHAITKMSYLHLTSAELHRKRVIQMGEDPDRVFNVGAMGVENALKVELLDEDELALQMAELKPVYCADLTKGVNSEIREYIRKNLTNRMTAVLTFHSVTLEADTALGQIREILATINSHQDILFIATKANADTGGRIINEALKEYAENNSNLILFDSLGMRRYLSVISYSSFVIGNSSSGLIEVPSLGVPTINIGDRQKGRLRGETVIDCEPIALEIDRAIETACTEEFQTICKSAVSPYGDGKTSKKVVEIITDYLLNNKLEIRKTFYEQEGN